MGKTRTAKHKFKHSINRKRVNKKHRKVGNFKLIGSVIKSAWEEKATLRSNMKNMGLAFDPNEALKIPTAKQSYKELMSSKPQNDKEETQKRGSPSTGVVQQLETIASAPREKKFSLPQSQVVFLTYLLDKYGEDYKAMAKDRKNIWQETWKQIRAKVEFFKRIPEQWAKYLLHREELEKEEGT